MGKAFKSKKALKKFSNKAKVMPKLKEESIIFNRETFIKFTSESKSVDGVSLLSPYTFLLHDLWVGMPVGNIGTIDSIIADKDTFYCGINGSFYSASIVG